MQLWKIEPTEALGTLKMKWVDEDAASLPIQCARTGGEA